MSTLDLSRMRIMAENQMPTQGVPMLRFPLMHGVNPVAFQYYNGNSVLRNALNPSVISASTGNALNLYQPQHMEMQPTSYRSDNSSESPPHDQSDLSIVSRNNAPERQCLICGDRATGLHYGIISCEGCKGFFKRSICNRRVYRCSRDKQCMMSRKQRNRCQYCRLRKCLESGMNRKAIREDGMPGGRNKSIGPVTLNEEEIDRVLNGSEFELERQIEAQSQLSIGQGSQPSLPSISQSNPHPALHGTPTTLMSALTTMSNQTNQSQASLSLLSSSQHQSQSSQSASNLAQIMYHQSQQANQGINAMRNQFGVAMPRPAAPVIQTQLTSGHTNEDDPVGDIIQLEDKSEPASLTNANQKYDTITTQELLQLLGRTADELMSRQIMWVKNLPFFDDLSVKDYTTLLINTWAESMLLAALTIHRQAIFDNLAQVTDRYTPSPEDCRISENSNEMELIQRINDMFNKFVLLDISHEEFCIMKLINFLNHDIQGLQEPVKVEALNKRFWFLCQHWLAARQGPQQRFRDLITSIPDIRLVASKLKKVPSEKISFLFKAVLQTCRISNTRMQIQQQQQQQQQSLQQNMLQQAPNQR